MRIGLRSANQGTGQTALKSEPEGHHLRPQRALRRRAFNMPLANIVFYKLSSNFLTIKC